MAVATVEPSAGGTPATKAVGARPGLTWRKLHDIVAGAGQFIRLAPETQNLLPAGGLSSIVAPATYGDSSKDNGADKDLREWSRATKCAYFPGRTPSGEPTTCVTMNSVSAEGNALEMGLEVAREAGAQVPDIVIDFTLDTRTAHLGRIGALQTPHRAYDALCRDSLLDGRPLMETALGLALKDARPRYATPLLASCPAMLVLGAWHSQGAAGGGGAKFGRALRSEIVGYGAVPSTISASRIDPAGISKKVPVYKAAEPAESPAKTGKSRDLFASGTAAARGPNLGWESSPEFADQETVGGKPAPVLYKPKRSQGKEQGTAALLNHSNVMPSVRSGRATIEGAVHTMELSLGALRTLSFPEHPGGRSTPQRDLLARTALAALALVAMTQRLHAGYHLRSGCNLIAERAAQLEVVGPSLEERTPIDIDADGAVELLKDAVSALRKEGMPWGTPEQVTLVPSVQLIEVIAASRDLADDAEAAG